MQDLKLQRAWIIHQGEHTYAVHEKVEASPLPAFLKKAAKMRWA